MVTSEKALTFSLYIIVYNEKDSFLHPIFMSNDYDCEKTRV